MSDARRPIGEKPGELSLVDGALPERRAVRRRRSPGACSHRKVEADEERRMLQCESCGYWIEAFDWLWLMASNEERLIDLQSDVRKAYDELADVKR